MPAGTHARQLEGLAWVVVGVPGGKVERHGRCRRHRGQDRTGEVQNPGGESCDQSLPGLQPWLSLLLRGLHAEILPLPCPCSLGELCRVQGESRRHPSPGARSQEEAGGGHAFQRLRPLSAGRARLAADAGVPRGPARVWLGSRDPDPFAAGGAGCGPAQGDAAGFRGLFHRHR